MLNYVVVSGGLWEYRHVFSIRVTGSPATIWVGTAASISSISPFVRDTAKAPLLDSKFTFFVVPAIKTKDPSSVMNRRQQYNRENPSSVMKDYNCRCLLCSCQSMVVCYICNQTFFLDFVHLLLKCGSRTKAIHLSFENCN